MWLSLSLLAAFSLATADTITKRHFSVLDPFEMGIIRLTYTLPWLVGAIFFIPWPHLDRVFFICLACGLPLEALAFYCYMRAIKVSPLSLTLPFLAFTPVFMILTGWIVLGETLTYLGVMGIVLIVIGSYFLNLSQARTGFFEPFKAVFKETGSWLMLITSFIYSLTSVIGKLAILHSSPYFFAVSYFIMFTLVMLSFVPLVPGVKAQHFLIKPRWGIALGGVMALMIFSHMLAISMVQAAYMIAVKRTSLVFGVLYGAWVFKEENIAERLVGALVMILGVFIIALSMVYRV